MKSETKSLILITMLTILGFSSAYLVWIHSGIVQKPQIVTTGLPYDGIVPSQQLPSLTQRGEYILESKILLPSDRSILELAFPGFYTVCFWSKLSGWLKGISVIIDIAFILPICWTILELRGIRKANA